MPDDIEKVKMKIIPILKKHEIKKAGLFGSLVRGELSPESDIDILVQIDKDISLWDFIGIKIEIENELNRKVDLVEYSEIKPLLRNSILKEQVALL